jgi:hypothetical protein
VSSRQSAIRVVGELHPRVEVPLPIPVVLVEVVAVWGAAHLVADYRRALRGEIDLRISIGDLVDADIEHANLSIILVDNRFTIVTRSELIEQPFGEVLRRRRVPIGNGPNIKGNVGSRSRPTTTAVGTFPHLGRGRDQRPATPR